MTSVIIVSLSSFLPSESSFGHLELHHTFEVSVFVYGTADEGNWLSTGIFTERNLLFVDEQVLEERSKYLRKFLFHKK